MEATQILKNMIKWNGPLNFTKHFNIDVEESELAESLKKGLAHAPTEAEINTYLSNLIADLQLEQSVQV